MTSVLIKKYVNNKMYIPKGNTERPGLITTKGIVNLLQKGKSVKVIDNVNGEDITVKVLKLCLEHVEIDVERLEKLIRG